MTETLIKEWFKRLPDWVFTISSLIFLALIAGISIMVWIAVKRYADSIGRENRLVALQEENKEMISKANKSISEAAQLQTVIINSRSFINSLIELPKTESPAYYLLIQRVIEGLASDIKAYSGERHRCGFWIEEKDQVMLRLSNGSAGFPENYIDNRLLDINNSVAGRCFRKKQSINIPDVTLDSDWSSLNSSNSYKALICIPVGSWGVITIDAKEPMEENAQVIGELYSVIIEGIFDNFMKNFEKATNNQAASGVE